MTDNSSANWALLPFALIFGLAYALIYIIQFVVNALIWVVFALIEWQQESKYKQRKAELHARYSRS